MIETIKSKLRDDLVITEKPGTDDNRTVYVVENPDTGELLEFGPEEFFLCQTLGDVSTPEEILLRFEKEFENSITEEHFYQFYRQIKGMGLLEDKVNGQATKLLSLESGFRDNVDSDRSLDDEKVVTKGANSQEWILFNPESLFCYISSVVRPFHLFFFCLTIGLFPGLIIATYTVLKNHTLLYQDIAVFGNPLSYLGRLLFSLLLINLFRCAVQGVLCSCYGGKVKEFGIRLRFGILPRFFIDRSAINKFHKKARLWMYGSSILVRLFLAILGVCIWYQFRNTGTQLAGWGIMIMQAGIFGFIIVSLPIRTSDGYRWLVTFFNLPPSLFQQSFEILKRMLHRQPLPSTISSRKRVSMLSYSFLILVAWGLFFYKISTTIANGLNSSFPGIWGRATPVLFLGVVVVILGRWITTNLFKGKNKNTEIYQTANAIKGGIENDLLIYDESSEPKKKSWVKLLIIVGIVVVLAFPLPYHRGGEIRLLPPQQQKVQARISGKIIGVFFNGGDGVFIKEGTIIAKMSSSEIDNSILILDERVLEQQAKLKICEANLNKLVVGPREEEIAEARARLEESQKEFEIAKKQLESAKVRATYSGKELFRVESLCKEGIYGIRDLDQAKEKAEIDRIGIEEKQNNLEAKNKNWDKVQAQLDLLLKGAPKDDIEAGRQEVEAAKSELRRLNQEQNYAQNKESETALLMPFNGYIVEAYIKQKIGSILNKGDTFAVVQNDHQLLVEMKLPESDVGGILESAPAEIKLLAYPSKPIEGKVVAIEPVTSEEDYGLVFNVQIKITEPEFKLRPGMSGFGKINIGRKPLISTLTGPFMRFFNIEIWSWFP